jgi:hypothetical protein
MNANATVDYRNTYGSIETNGLVDGPAYHEIDRETVDWTERGLKITRLRLLTDPCCPFYDVSYCHGTLNGKPVTVSLPFHQVPKVNPIPFLIDEAKKENVFAKGLGLLDKGNWSILK